MKIKKIAAFLLAGAMMAAMFVVPASAEELKVVVHYDRPDGDYEGWTVWMWPDSGEGAAYEFSSTGDNGAVCEATISADATIGFIVRYGDWEAKDVEQDLIMDVTKAVDGVLTIYVESGNPDFAYATAVPISAEVEAPAAGDTAAETAGDSKGNADTGIEGVAVVAGIAVVAAGAVLVSRKRK